jgi:hypothetical protein
VSCPDWKALAVARAAHPESDPPEWGEARAHLAACPACRAAAVAADPLLLFSRLAPAQETPRAADPEMLDGVLALVRASRVAGGEAPVAASPARSARRVRRARIAAAILLASLFALSDSARRPASTAAVEPEIVAAESGFELAVESDPAEPLLPAVEDLDRPEARIYELSEADLAVVLIVDPGFDV